MGDANEVSVAVERPVNGAGPEEAALGWAERGAERHARRGGDRLLERQCRESEATREPGNEDGHRPVGSVSEPRDMPRIPQAISVRSEMPSRVWGHDAADSTRETRRRREDDLHHSGCVDHCSRSSRW